MNVSTVSQSERETLKAPPFTLQWAVVLSWPRESGGGA